MHSTLAGLDEYPWHSMPTDELIKKDLGVNWENVYQNREGINTLWTVRVTNK